jgi:hypothetical protein
LRKLQVFDTAIDIYAFVWKELVTIIRLSWFPLLLAAIANYFALRP